MSDNYIIQNMKQVSKFDYLIDYDPYEDYYIEQTNIIDISFDELFKSHNKRYMVVAEPGYGKTRFLKEIVIKAVKLDKKVLFLDSKKIANLSIEKSLEKCKHIELDNISEDVLQKKSKFRNFDDNLDLSTVDIVCIDALDEVAIEKLYVLFESIEDFIEEYPNIKLFLSCRTHHLKKINFDFEQLEFKFITLSQFNYKQIQIFIEQTINRKIDLNELIKKSKMSDLMEFLSIPRYLYYFTELLENGSLNEVIKLPRVKMFDHFIYRKLEKELQTNTHDSQRDLLKRVLEKLALIMKINGVSEITKDELMSIFDQMDSNFSQIAFRGDLIDKLYDRSLLKNNIETIEFENQEFLDYLAAKELSRFDKVEQVFFDVAMEPHILEIYPTWFYVLPFLLEFKPTIIGVYLDFIENNLHRELKVDYFEILTFLELNNLPNELKSRIFDLVFDYHDNHNKWLVHLTRPLALFYDESKYQKIIDSINGSKYRGEPLLIHRANAVLLISILIKYNFLDKQQIESWKKKIKEWIKLDVVKNQVLYRNIASSLSSISAGDFKWIKSLYPIFKNGIQTQEEYARACFEIAPNDRFSIDVYFSTDKFFHKNKRDGSLIRGNSEYNYIMQLTSVDTIKYAFDKILKDKNLLFSFCESIDDYFDGKIKVKTFQKQLQKICNDELLVFFKKSILKLLDKDIHHSNSYQKLYELFLQIVLEKDSTYLEDILKIIHNFYCENRYWCEYYTILPIINVVDFDDFVKHLNIFGEDKKEMLIDIYYQDVESDIKSKIKKLYSSDIKKREKESQITKHQFDYCKEWEEQIESEPNKFSTNLFKYFNINKTLNECPNYNKNLDQMIKLAKEILKNNNPLNGEIEKHNDDRSTVRQVYYYYDCIKFVHSQNVSLEQAVIDNVFRYLPFNINNDYEVTLSVASNPSKKAIQDIMDVYRGKRDDDLGIVHIRQFVELYSKMRLKQIEPILLNMLKEKDISENNKEVIVNSLPQDILTVDIINENRKKLEKYSSLDKTYLSKLILQHKDNNAINEAFEWTKKRAEEMTESHFSNYVDERHNAISFQMANTKYDIKKDKELLLLSSKLAIKGKKSGADFCQKIVKTHLKFLIEEHKQNSFEIINEVEKFLRANSDKEYLHWFEYRLSELKEVYLNQIHEQNIIASIKKYNQLQKADYMAISSTKELLEVVNKIIEKDIRRWIEDEGAYKHIQELAKKDTNTNSEDFIQKSIKSQIELALLKRGFRETDFKIIREEQLLDDKRLDFTISYGFIGSIVIELKLSHNSEAIANRKDGKEYIKKLKSYMDGSNSQYSIFFIFNVIESKDKFKKQLLELNKLYESEQNILVVGLDCINV